MKKPSTNWTRLIVGAVALLAARTMVLSQDKKEPEPSATVAAQAAASQGGESTGTFRFDGGNTRDFVRSIAAHFQVDWISVATIPRDLEKVEVPRIRLATQKAGDLLVLSKGNETEAHEVLQTVAIKLAGRFQVFDDETRLWAWLRRLAHNAFVDHYRVRQRNGRHVPLDLLAHDPMEREPEERRLSEAVRDALHELPPDESELMRAVYLDGRPLQALADESGQTYKAVESRLGRLRQKLKTRLLFNLRHE